jgi:sugar phosphate isomerase/epimerase
MAKRISIGTWVFATGPHADRAEPFGTVCDRVKALKFDGVELAALAPNPNASNPDGSDADWPWALADAGRRAEIRARMTEEGLAFSAVVANLRGEKLINTDDPSPYIAAFQRNAAFARDLGIPMLRIDCVQPPTVHREVSYRTAMERVARTWQTCCDIAADHGLQVTWEFEPCFAFNKPTDLLRIHDAVDKANFGLLYDTAHGQMVGVNGARQEGLKEVCPSQIEFLHALRGRINHVHLSDSDDTCQKDASGRDINSTRLPLGEGVLNFSRIMPALIKACRPGVQWWTIDLQSVPDAWAAAEVCKRRIDALNTRFD